MKRRLFMIFSVFLCMFLSSNMIYAEEEYDSNRKGSITVQLDDIGTPRNDVGLSLYPVANVEISNGTLVGFKAIDAYSTLGIDFNDLQDATKHKNAVKQIMEKNESDNIFAMSSLCTDTQGKCIFNVLEQGMYLVVQNDGFETYGTIDAFLVSIPLVEDEIILYDVKTETKAEKPKEETPSETPETSVNMHIHMLYWLLCSSFMIMVILSLIYNRKQRI